jgi:hypothetical protein
MHIHTKQKGTTTNKKQTKQQQKSQTKQIKQKSTTL